MSIISIRYNKKCKKVLTFSYNVIYYNQKEGRTTKQKKEVNTMIIEERKAKAHEVADQYFKEAQWWRGHEGDESPRTITCCARFAVAVEMYEILTGEKYN